MTLTRIFLKRPTLVFVFVGLTMLAGMMALRGLVVQQLPSTGQPSVTISASFAGASTTELVTDVAEPIEDDLAGLPNLLVIDTVIQNGVVSITAQFSLQSTNAENMANVEQALQAASRVLPTNMLPPTFRVANPSQTVVVTLALTSHKYSAAILGAIANHGVIPVIEQVNGVSQVIVQGSEQPAYMVTVDKNRLASYNLTLTDVMNSITPNNVRAPGGWVYGPGRETTLDIRGDLYTPQEVANLPIHVSGASVGTTSSTSTAPATGSAGSTSTFSVSGRTALGGSSSSSSSSTSAGTPATSMSTGAGTAATPPPAASFSNVSPPPMTIAGAAPLSSATPSSMGVASAMTPAPMTVSSISPQATSTSAASTSTTSTRTTASGAVALGEAPPGTSSTSTTSTSAASPQPSATGSGFAVPAFGTSSSTTGSSTSTSTSTATTLLNPNFTVDQPTTMGAINSNTAASSATATTPGLPSGTASGYGIGAGTSTSPYVGQTNPWGVPSADKRVSDVAKVYNSTLVPRVFASEDGEPGVTLLIQKETTASEVTVADEVLRAMPALQAQYPDIHFALAHNQSTYTDQQVQGVQHTLVEGIILTAVVMLFFLSSWRNSIVVMVAIPTSLGVTLFVMYMMHLTLDTISLMAMTLVVGVLIDDSTVVLENMERHLELGEAPADAALKGRSEIGLAAMVLTFVDVIVFLPIAFAGGQVGQILHEFAIVVTIATLTSLWVSFTVTPTLAGLWSMRSTWRPWGIIVWFNDRFDALREQYGNRWLPFALRHPWWFVVGAFALCAASFTLVPSGRVGEEFIPPMDQGIFTAQVVYPPGHPLAQTHATMTKLETETKRLVAPSDLLFETTVAGGYSAPFGGFVLEGNVGQIAVYLQENHSTSTAAYVARLQQQLPKLAPGAVVTVVEITAAGGTAQQPIDELVETADGSDPSPYAAKVFAQLVHTPGVVQAQDSASNVAPQMNVRFNQPALQALDVSQGTAATAVEAAFGGAVASSIYTPSVGLSEIEVIYPMSQQRTLQDLMNIPLRGTNGGIVRLGDLAYLQYSPAPLLITRENRRTAVHVSANVAQGANLSDATNTFLQRVAQLHLPKGVIVRPAALGQIDLMHQALISLGSSLVISIILVFFIIVALYNSYRTPFVTLFAIPVASIGALGSLWLTNETLNLFSLIGVIFLVGLVTKNGILLVDYADTMRERGKSRRDGMMEAAKTRFRPILMTTIAMVAGMLPLALGLEPGSQQRVSLGTVVIGGMLSSLVLTLVIVPIMYMWIAPAELNHGVTFADEKPAPNA